MIINLPLKKKGNFNILYYKLFFYVGTTNIFTSHYYKNKIRNI